jgi:hypothetical protein
VIQNGGFCAAQLQIHSATRIEEVVTRQAIASSLLLPCFGDNSQSLLEQAVFGFFIVLFFVAVTLNFVGSKKSKRASNASGRSPGRKPTAPPRGRRLAALWARCAWEIDILRAYLEETSSKFQLPRRSNVTARLSQPAEAPRTNERRRWTRRPSNMQAVCWLVGNRVQARWQARVRDISEGGVGLLAPWKLPLGAMLNLQLVTSNIVDRSTIQAEVMFMSQQPTGEWILGCEFITALTPEQQRLHL